MQIDLHPVAPEERRPRLLAAFGALHRGRGLTFASDRPETDVLEELQRAHAGEFEWFVLQEGPPVWQVVISRRPATASRQRQVLEYMETDHRRVHALLSKATKAAHAGAPEMLREACLHLRTGLLRHFRTEEEVLLPVIAERMGSPRGPAAVLRDEHVLILDLIEQLCDALRGEVESSHLTQRLEALRGILLNHSAMEERILYAVTDLLLNESERDEIVARCQRL